MLIRLTIKLNEDVLTYAQTCEFAKVYRAELIELIQNECQSLVGKKLPAPFNKLAKLKNCGPSVQMLVHFLWYLCYTTERDVESVFAFQKHVEMKRKYQKEFQICKRDFIDYSLSAYIELDIKENKVEQLKKQLGMFALDVIHEELEEQMGGLPVPEDVNINTTTSQSKVTTKDANLGETNDPSKVMFTIRDNTRTSQLTNEQNFSIIQQQYTKTMNGTMFRSYTNK